MFWLNAQALECRGLQPGPGYGLRGDARFETLPTPREGLKPRVRAWRRTSTRYNTGAHMTGALAKPRRQTGVPISKAPGSPVKIPAEAALCHYNCDT
jgi:hypothetical protein